MEYSYHGIIISNQKKNELLITEITYRNVQRNMLSEKNTNPKGYSLHDSIFITFLKQNYSDREQISACQELKMGSGGREVGRIREMQ